MTRALAEQHTAGMDRDDDLMLRLWEAAGERRTDRRSYEWKVTLGLWAGLVAVAKLALDSRSLTSPAHHWVVVVAAAAPVMVAAFHAFYEWGFVFPANKRDRDEALQLESLLRRHACLPAIESDGKWPKRWGLLCSRSA